MNVVEGHRLDQDLDRRCDVCVIGSGAGGSVVAAQLAQAGLDVVVLEEGGAYGRADFALPDERFSYPNLYQERGTRATADRAITVLQGRALGGGTLVNWTTCFRTPDPILAHWRDVHGVSVDAAQLGPWFEQAEQRLGIAPWTTPNANNDVLRRGCEALGWRTEALHRNVRGCADSGMCGLGCPVDAKQAMHLTYLADAVAAGATVVVDVRAERLVRQGSRVVEVQGVTMRRGADRPAGRQVRIRPRLTVCAGGAINSPALLMRSGIAHPALGRRTFLHPVIAVLGEHPRPIAPYYGAPQSVSSHQFVDRGPERVGFFFEAAPMQPMLVASSAWAGGAELHQLMGRLPNLSGLIALHVDGLLAGDEGGSVRLAATGRPVLDYPIGAPLIEAFAASHEALARVHLAAGATEVISTHRATVSLDREAQLDRLRAAPYGALQHAVFSAHQMGGCAMGADPSRHVVDGDLAVRGVDGLHVVDGSVFPTALGVNPSLSIYGLAGWASQRLLARL